MGTRLFIGNLSYAVTEQELREAFTGDGIELRSVRVALDRETGRPRGFAFVEFEDDEAAQRSIAMLNGKDLKGRPLRVNEAENRPPRPPGMGGPPGGGGGGYRPSPGSGAPYRPSGPPGYGAAPPSFNDFVPMDDRGRPFKNKGSRRNIRRRKRGFD